MPWPLKARYAHQLLFYRPRRRILHDLCLQRYASWALLAVAALTKVDNNPMLRDGVTGDWYVLEGAGRGIEAKADVLGLGPFSDIKALSTKLDSLRIRSMLLQLLQISPRMLFASAVQHLLTNLQQNMGHPFWRSYLHPPTSPHCPCRRISSPLWQPSCDRWYGKEASNIRPRPSRYLCTCEWE